MEAVALNHTKSRDHLIRFFDGNASDRMEVLQERKTKRPLVMTKLLEIVDGHSNGAVDGLQALTDIPGLKLKQIKEALFFLSADEHGEIGFLEKLHPRINAVYSLRKSDEGFSRPMSFFKDNHTYPFFQYLHGSFRATFFNFLSSLEEL